MVYSDTTNKNGIIQRIEEYLSLPDGSITGDSTLFARVNSHVNEVYYDVFTEAIHASDTWDIDDTNHSDYAIATTPLVAAQRDYSFPASLNILKIKRVDITYDGSTYYRATQTDSAAFGFGIGNATDEDTNFTNESPAFDVKANNIWLYPLADATDVANGATMRIEFFRELDEFTTADTTQEPGIDRPWHDAIALGAAMQYAIIKNMPIGKNLKALYDEKILKLRQYYSRKVDPSVPVITPFLENYE